MRDRLIEILRQIDFDYSEECVCASEDGYRGVPDFAKFFADHLLSEGIIVPPCKVGDTVYYLNTHYHIALRRNTIYEAKVARIVVISLGVALVLHIRDKSGCCEVPDIKDFGKTVFLTREEAERALERSKE